jgi:predicted DNA-binding protein with PD1-like motif
MVIKAAVLGIALTCPDLQLDRAGRQEKVRSAVLNEPVELLAFTGTGTGSGCPVAHSHAAPAGPSGSPTDGNG